jgi:hypothetical protein
MPLYALTIFLSSFLLFQVQPVIAKLILPWFGGSSAVWATCMFFFQAVLLLGYLYAHWINERLSPRVQAFVHTLALAVSLAAIPVFPDPAWKAADMNPSLRILALLALTVGLPYFLLSSTSPLLQAWYARSHKQGMPYRLFALSNLASMLALLSYPALVEPALSLRTQVLVWSGGYACFAALCTVVAWRGARFAPAAEARLDVTAPEPSWTDRVLWFGLAAAASVLLLAVTNHLTQDVAAIPFLWILPLAIYLLSFILCFEAPRLYQRAVFLPILGTSLAFMAYRLTPHVGHVPMRRLIFLYALALFACCMVCHGELARLKPHPRRLTGFYVAVSLGGAFGGLFVSLAAPYLFRAYYEFPIGLALCAALVFAVLLRDCRRGPLPARRAAAGLAVVLCAYIAWLGYAMRAIVHEYDYVARNFYGQVRVYDSADPALDQYASRVFLHGVIAHGKQLLAGPYRSMPITYFCPESGIGNAMRALEGRPRRIGILGLGCGTLAAYGRPGDTLRMYEINPQVVEVARTRFTFLTDTPARVEMAVGDGRLLLESEADQQFDLLVMDAFSGDSIPVHLLTLEAFRTYFRHLKPGGILAVNVTNSYLNLAPVVERAAAAFKRGAWVHQFKPDDGDVLCSHCHWALIMSVDAVAANPQLVKGAVRLRERPFRTWTDDFSNLYGVLR